MKKCLLDAMMPRALAEAFSPPITHVAHMGWQELRNGELLKTAETARFDVLISKDGNMPYQQNMQGRKIALLIVKLRSQSVKDLVAMAANIESAAQKLSPGEVAVIEQA